MQKIITITMALVLILTLTVFSVSNINAKMKPGKTNIKKSDTKENIALLSRSKSETKSEQDNNKSIFKKTKTIRIINLGQTVNSKYLDYAPTITADGRTLYFVSNRPGSKFNTKTDEYSHDFWATKKAERLDTVFFKPYNIDTTTNLGDLGVNTIYNEGAASIAADRQSLYFTGCNRPDGLGSCDIYKTEIQGDKWGRPVNLGQNVNSGKWESQPSITASKDRLYFVSNRPGPNGDDNFDIWYCDYDWDMEEFKPAKNLTQINTKGKELSPFIGADGVTLFFASDGYPGDIGGLDFYVTRYNEETKKWQTPEDLGEPINTKDDEQFITLPAGGDVLYFSSKRTDLPGYQGSYDLFMAFVPSFYKTKILKVTVVDQCSQEFIPAAITIKNPLTGRTYKDSVTNYKKEFQIIISNSDYGNPKDNNAFVNLEIIAQNDKYGETSKVQTISKPKTTEHAEEAGKSEGELLVTLTLGKMPLLKAEIEESEHVRIHKIDEPQIADFRGLVMKEVQTWDLYPLLNYVFFGLGSANIPPRYILFNSPEETKNFSDTTIAGGTLDKYYHLLNIYGFRLKKYPKSKIEIVGCNDGTMADEKKPDLSKNRATVVYNYLKNIWGINGNRMKIVVRKKPKVVSNIKDSLGIQENRRVEILCNDWNIMKPVFDKNPTIFPQPTDMKFVMKNGIEDMLVKKRRIEITHDGQKWATINDIGTNDFSKVWDWYSKDGILPTDNNPFKAQLIITTNNDKECKSPIINIPVMQVKTEDRKIGTGKDSTLERYSLILFPFDRSDAGKINGKIMKEYVYNRIFPTSVVDVIGHTDVVGLYDHNAKLSVRRSNTVYNGIQKKTRGKYAKLIKRGVGEDEPLYNNNLPEGRFYNRTVQVIIKTPLDQFEK